MNKNLSVRTASASRLDAFIQTILQILTAATLTGLAAQIAVPFPGTPVPLTLQTFAVMTLALTLPKHSAILGQIFYILGGVAGLPWFAGASFGPATLLGPTGGYLLGFVITTFLISYFSKNSKTFSGLILKTFVCQIIGVHGLGILGLALWFSFFAHTPKSFSEILLMGTMPFLLGDLCKCGLACLSSKAIQFYKK